MKIKRFWNLMKVAIYSLPILLLFINFLIISSTQSYVYTYSDLVPNEYEAYIFPNESFMEVRDQTNYLLSKGGSATELYKKGKVSLIHEAEYVEGNNVNLSEMLLQMGVPKDKIEIQPSTDERDALTKVKTGKLVLVSNNINIERAVYSMRKLGYNAVGFRSKPVASPYNFLYIIADFGLRIKYFFVLN